jgi:hypothetical protein
MNDCSDGIAQSLVMHDEARQPAIKIIPCAFNLSRSVAGHVCSVDMMKQKPQNLEFLTTPTMLTLPMLRSRTGSFVPAPAVEVAPSPSTPANNPAGVLFTPTSAGVELEEQGGQGSEALTGGVGGKQRLVGVEHGRLGNAAAAASDGGGGASHRGGGMGNGGGVLVGDRGEVAAAAAAEGLAVAGRGYESANAPHEAPANAREAGSSAEGGVTVSASVVTHCRITIFVKTLTGKTISLKGIHPGRTPPPKPKHPGPLFLFLNRRPSTSDTKL